MSILRLEFWRLLYYILRDIFMFEIILRIEILLVRKYVFLNPHTSNPKLNKVTFHCSYFQKLFEKINKQKINKLL